MPKSIAPMDSRLAEAFCTSRQMKANSNASGMAVATINPARTSYRKNIRTTTTSSMPRNRFRSTVWVVSAISSLRS